MTTLTTHELMHPIPKREGDPIKRSCGADMGKKVRGFGFKNITETEIAAEFISGSGQYVMLPKGTNLIKRIRTLLERRIARELGFEEVILPKIAPVETFRMAGILGKWDNYLLSARPFSNTQGVTEEYLMDPLQCTVFYRFFHNHTLEAGDLPIRWYDCSGPTYRNEDCDNITPLVKQREFHRAEFMYIGTKAQAVWIREECLARLEEMCIELGLEYRIVVGAGCYEIGEGKVETPRSLDEIPIKDLEICCPGHRNKDGEPFLEVAGSSVLANSMTARFNITSQDGTELWSGCTGIGLERMLYSLLTNYGPRIEGFPAGVRKVIE